ncbi:FAD dependent oxidoreductase [Pseudomonas fluorescens Q2-87]|uniref:FAD dependent oxidoreductase n=1 Tax=Pseudomonas fluorescens (strain Q2-87) TaxID=1038922 RepID=J2Y622_PSEFQ|nr:FAD-dependent oxidoreductase [Pseudomonas fluorescens]EJL02249.1 FAD dependent oxidoreductase [Pseudomonas fluorescens Q2-87]
MIAAVKKVLVIGGGFSGMTAAIQLARQGVEVDLVEIDPLWCPLGAGITLSGPTLRALDTVGILERVAEEGYLSTDFDVFSPAGDLIVQLALRPPVSHKQIPCGGGILRPVLARIFADKTREVGTHVRLGITFDSIVERGDGVEVSFTDGTAGRYDLVIAADGVHSRIRKELFAGAPSPRPIHQSVWRAVLKRPPEIVRPTHWLGRTKVGVNPISATHMYMFLMENRDSSEWIDPANWPSEMARLLGEFPAPILQTLVPQLYKPGASIDYRPLANLLVPLPWHKGRIVMIGDTVHATTPHLASGAGIGIESAIVLAEELFAASDLQAALSRFEARRWERCQLVVENSARLCEIEKSGGDKQEHARIMGDSMATLAEPI